MDLKEFETIKKEMIELVNDFFDNKCFSYLKKKQNVNLREGAYKDASDYSEGFARVQLADGERTFIDRNGKPLDGKYKDASGYSEGFARVQLADGKWTFIDRNGNLYLSEDGWKEHISKAPADYKLIPPRMFQDIGFMKAVNTIMKEVLSSYINGAQFNPEKTDESQKELQAYVILVNEIIEMVNAKIEDVKNDLNDTKKKCKNLTI